MFAGTIDWLGCTNRSLSLRQRLHDTRDYSQIDGTNLQLASFVHPALPGYVSRLGRHDRLPVQAALDGVLHNRRQLASELSMDGGTEDIELLLAAYVAWGDRLLDHLVGDFAFSIWDERQQRLLAAIDPFGLRGFFHGGQAGLLSFATHPGPLRCLSGIGGQLNERMIARYLLDRWGEAEETFYADIRQLPAGHRLCADAAGVRVERYWQPGSSLSVPAGPDEAMEEFDGLCGQALRERLPAAEPAGLVMSGGIDSTTLCGLAAELRGREENPPPFTVIAGVFPGLPCDESSYIDAALEHAGLPGCRVPDLSRGLTAEGMHAEVRRHGGPLLNPQAPLFDAIKAAAQERGVNVLLNGLGGDELCTDYAHLTDMMRNGQWRRLASAVRAIFEDYPGWRTAAWLARELCPEWLKGPYRLVRRLRPQRAKAYPDWLRPEARNLLESYPENVAPRGPRRPCQSLEEAWKVLIAPFTQNVFWHWNNEMAAGGLRSTSPFLDRRLFELVFSLPFPLRPRCDDEAPFKPFLTRGLRRCLPEKLRLRRDKTSLSSYGNHVFALGFKELHAELLAAGSDWQLERFVSRQDAARLFDAFRFDAEENVRQPEQVAARQRPLRQLAAVELWLRSLNTAL